MTTDAAASQPGMLAYLANRFTNQTETLATEALGYILSHSASARGVIGEMLKSGGVDVGPIAHAQTEVDIEVKGTEKKARVDLVGYGEGNAKRALIEVKFWAGLTENQPNTYLAELLKNDHPSALLFVAPESRLDMLWGEVLHRANAGGFALEEATGAGLRSAVVNGGPHRMMLTSWATMLGEMSRKAGDLTVEKDIQQLQVLCDQQDRAAFLPLHEGEVGPNFSKRAIDIFNLYNAVVARLKKESVVNFGKFAANKQGANYGRYIHLGDIRAKDSRTGIVDGAWVGVNYEWGTRRRETPFWVMLGYGYSEQPKIDQIRERLNAARLQDGLDVIHTEFNKYPVSLVPIRLPTGVEYDDVLDDVVSQIRRIGEILAAPEP